LDVGELGLSYLAIVVLEPGRILPRRPPIQNQARRSPFVCNLDDRFLELIRITLAGRLSLIVPLYARGICREIVRSLFIIQKS
jgi:hypothetical protein